MLELEFFANNVAFCAKCFYKNQLEVILILQKPDKYLLLSIDLQSMLTLAMFFFFFSIFIFSASNTYQRVLCRKSFSFCFCNEHEFIKN